MKQSLNELVKEMLYCNLDITKHIKEINALYSDVSNCTPDQKNSNKTQNYYFKALLLR